MDSPELQRLLDEIAENAALACGAGDAVIRLAEGNRLLRVAHYGPIPPSPPYYEDMPLDTTSYGGRAVLQNRSLQADAQQAAPDASLVAAHERALRDGYAVMLATPLPGRDAPLGVIFIRRHAGSSFTPQQVGRLEGLTEGAWRTVLRHQVGSTGGGTPGSPPDRISVKVRYARGLRCCA